MMINKKNRSLIVLLVLVALPRSSKSFISRLTKRSTDDGACEQSTSTFCSKIINNENGLLQRFNPDTSQQIKNHFENATANCKVLLCVMTMYAVLSEGEQYFPQSPFINDAAFVNVIKGTNLVECENIKNIYNTKEVVHNFKRTTDDKSFTTDTTSNEDFNHFENALQQDTQSTNSNQIESSLNESKQEPRVGVIDILYTNENYTNAAAIAKDMNEQADTNLDENNTTMGSANEENTDGLEMKIDETTPPFIAFLAADYAPPKLDIGNRILGDTRTSDLPNADTVSSSEFEFVSSFTASMTMPLDFTDVTVTPNSDASDDVTKVNVHDITEGTKRVLTLETSSMPQTSHPALSQVGNIIFQLLGEEGFNSFSCNLSVASDDVTTNDSEEKSMYRRRNKNLDSKENVNSSLEKDAFEPVDKNSLPRFPESLRDDPKIKFLFVEFNIYELCNFTSHNIESISNKLTSCSNGISKVEMQAEGEAKIILEKYLQDLLKATKKMKVIQESKMKIVKIINLTDYVSSTIKDSDIPKDLKSKFFELKQFLLVELKNEDLFLFHPDTNRKDVFMVQMFDYLIQSKNIDNKKKKLLEIFKKFIRNVS